jgi:Tfp pilus assembly protein PilF
MGSIKVKGLTCLLAGMLVLGLCCTVDGAQKTAEQYIVQGKEFLKNQQYDQAIDSFTQALKRSPQSTKALNNRGIAYSVKGDLDLAVADFSQALRINPKFGKAYHNRAVAYWYMGKKDKAEADIKKAAGLGIKVDKTAWVPVPTSAPQPDKESQSPATPPPSPPQPEPPGRNP